MIRLFTFDRLSLLRENESGLQGAVDALSSRMAAFDHHVLQTTQPTSLLDVIGSRFQQERLKRRLGTDRPPFVTITRTADDGPPCPAGFRAVTDQVFRSAELAECLRRRCNESQSHLLQWIHVVSDREQRAADVAVALDVLAAAANDDHSMIITALAGTPRRTEARFPSLLNEDHVRVPLWLRTPAVNEGRCVRLSGSHDVLETILSGFPDESAAENAPPHGPLNLERVFLNHGGLMERVLRIEFEEGTALRTDDFLLVRCRQMDTDNSSVALYGKPHDVWNVHDVSHEFPDVVESLISRLDDMH